MTHSSKLHPIGPTQITSDVQGNIVTALQASPPMRRIPSELLVDIFAMCWHSFAPFTGYPGPGGTSFETEIAHLAHAPLTGGKRVGTCHNGNLVALATSLLRLCHTLDRACRDVSIQKITAAFISGTRRPGLAAA